MISASVIAEPLDPAGLLAGFAAANPGVGAIASFTGHMRGSNADGRVLRSLILEGYRGMTLASIDAIVTEAAARFAIGSALAVHRIGCISPGEAIVFVAAAAPHRRAAFDAVDWMMDQLKSRALLWKREEEEDGSMRWIEPTPADWAALARWDAA